MQRKQASYSSLRMFATDQLSAAAVVDHRCLLKEYLLARIAAADVERQPFHHCFIDHILPQYIFDELVRFKQQVKLESTLEERRQDSRAFVNRRFRLAASREPVVALIRDVFHSSDVKEALFKKFYLCPLPRRLGRVRIHHREFEFVFCRPNLFQDIHVDIPPKLLSFVFYLPDKTMSSVEAVDNGTILYDKQMRPAGRARYQPNSMCVFAPHFNSYHGFATTIERDAMVLFYVDPVALWRWDLAERLAPLHSFDVAPFQFIKHEIKRKLQRFPLLEYAHSSSHLDLAKQACLINAPKGRVQLGK
jgi:hypothetical protein